MELVIGARALLRFLLTLLMLYSHIAAGQVPGSDTVGDTLLDDEDVNIGKGTTGIQFTVEMLSNVKSASCFHAELREAVQNRLKSKLITALKEDCKCQTSVNVIDREKLECVTESLVRYSGQISEWTSSLYTIKQLSEFIDSWRAQIEVNGSATNFAAGAEFKFVFNVTNSQSSVEDFGSGDGGTVTPIVDDFGSGDIVTIEVNIPGGGEVENIGTGSVVGGLNSISGVGGLRPQEFGFITTLCTASAIVLLSFV